MPRKHNAEYLDVECPDCNLVASDEAWDEETSNQYNGKSVVSVLTAYNGNMLKVSDPYHMLHWYCPHCISEVSGEDLIITEVE